MLKITKEDLLKLDKETLVDMVYSLMLKVEAMTSELEGLRDEIRQLRIPKNSGNSSRPPSSDLFVHKNQSLRVKSGKSRGGQPGHKGETLSFSAVVDKTIDHMPGEKCPRCGKVHSVAPELMAGARQVVDIPEIKASVVEHRVYQRACSCGFVDTGSFPAGVAAPVQYGENLTSLVSYLSSRQYVPYSRLSELIQSITNISLSVGTIFNMLNKTADAMLPVYAGIKEEISRSTTIGGDETGLKVGKSKFWAWTWQTIRATYIVVSNNRGFATVKDTFPDGFPVATYVSDSLGTQLKTPAGRHQLCTAHLLRELNFFRDLYHHKWADDMKALLNRAIGLKAEARHSGHDNIQEKRAAILKEFEVLLAQSLPDTVPKMLTFQKRLKKRRHQVFNFLFYPDVPADNNGSERAIRNIKVKQKVSGSFRSERGAEIFAILRSVVDTAIKKGGNPFEAIRFAINTAACKNQFLINRQKQIQLMAVR